MVLDKARKELEREITSLVLLYEIEKALDQWDTVRAFNPSFEAHCFEATRYAFISSIVQSISRMTDRVSRRNRDRASFFLVLELLERGTIGCQVLSEFQSALENLSQRAACVRDYRHAHIGHTLLLSPKPTLMFKDVDQAYVAAIQCFLKMEMCFGSHWDLTETENFYRRCAAKYSLALRRGMQFRGTLELARTYGIEREIAKLQSQRLANG